MNNDIKYSGYSAVPSDYECADGDLALALNLIQEDRGVVALPQPSTLVTCNLGGIVKIIHHVPGQDNYIIARPSGDATRLYFLPKPDKHADENSAAFIAQFSHINHFAIVGSVIALATVSGLEYILWKDGAYIPLPSRPPFVPISFGMTRVGTCTDYENLNIVFERAARTDVRPSGTEENTNAVLGLLLSSVTDNITSKGYFYMPFFVRYAYRLFDGSYSWHSVPVLMLPSVVPPIIKVGNYTKDIGTQSVPSTLDVPYFSLDYKVLPFGASSSLKAWKDLVTGIDIFISAPIYTYDQSKPVNMISPSRSILLNAYYDWNPDGLDLRSHPDLCPDKIFTGHYAASRDEPFSDHFQSTSGDSSVYAWHLPINEKFHDQIKSCSLFYKVASIDIDSIAPTGKYARLKFDSFDWDALAARPTLPDDYQSHCSVVPNSLFTFNSRLNIGGAAVAPAPPLPLHSCVQASAIPDDAPDVTVSVYNRTGGILSSAKAQAVRWDVDSAFPRYLFYPDASACKMSFRYGDNEIIIDLKPHDFLNGAFYYGTLGIDSKPAANVTPVSGIPSSIVPMENKIYTSEVNNPFFFPVSGINSVGSGSIIGLSSAAKALSQGQFGQFPLYAFTTDGIWALEVSPTGAFVARQPISRDVCINPGGITQIDSAVLFPTDRGIMLISGSQTQCISDVINSDTPFDPLSLPGMRNLHDMLGHDDTGAAPDTCLPILPFSEFLSECCMLYDYVHQRIIVSSKNCAYAYVYSLKSKHWGLAHARISSPINAYPDALAVDIDGNVVDFSRPSSDSASGLLVTRPVKLGAPDVLKTIQCIIQRGHFRHGHVQSCLYGSRDLYSWHLVWSSRDHCLRGFSGSPYKYFRIALLCSLAPDESILGASVHFAHKLTNQPR